MNYVIIEKCISGLPIVNMMMNEREVTLLEVAPRMGNMKKCNVVKGSLIYTAGNYLFIFNRKEVIGGWLSFG